jgi:hypothetical protein
MLEIPASFQARQAAYAKLGDDLILTDDNCLEQMPKEISKGLVRRGVCGGVASAGQALVGRKGPTPFWGLACLRALPETPRHCHHFGNLFRHLLYAPGECRDWGE